MDRSREDFSNYIHINYVTVRVVERRRTAHVTVDLTRIVYCARV